jgi:hypothetical protein
MIFLAPMEPSVRKVVEQVQFAQPVRVDNSIQNSKFKMQIQTAPKPRGDVRNAINPVVP